MPIERAAIEPAFEPALAKVPAVTLGFWVVKVLATTLGETAGDTLSMSAGLGYLAGSACFLLLLPQRAGAGERAHG